MIGGAAVIEQPVKQHAQLQRRNGIGVFQTVGQAPAVCIKHQRERGYAGSFTSGGDPGGVRQVLGKPAQAGVFEEVGDRHVQTALAQFSHGLD